MSTAMHVTLIILPFINNLPINIQTYFKEYERMIASY